MRPRPLTAGALVCLMLVAVSTACSGSGSDASSTAETKVATPDTRKLNGPGCQYIVAGTEARSTPPGDTLEYLTSAVAEGTTCYDKITFEFDPGDGPDLPPGYTVEYRKPPFVEGITSSTEGFKDAKYVLYIEMRPTATKDFRTSPRGITTYKGNLRLLLPKDDVGVIGMRHTVIVEWLDKAPASLPDQAFATTSTSTSTTTATTKPKKSGSGRSGSGKAGSTTTSTPTTTATTSAPVGPTTTTTLSASDPASARVVWLIGLDSKRPFTVDASNQPPRIRVLIMH